MNFGNNLENSFKQLNVKKVIISIAVAIVYIFIAMTKMDLNYNIPTMIFWLSSLFLLAYYSFTKNTIRTYIVFGIFSIIASYFVYQGNWYQKVWYNYVIIIPFLFIFFIGAANIIDKINICTEDKNLKNKKIWIISFIGLFIMWLPYFLIFGPVRLCPDSTWCVQQALDFTLLNNGHPILYTIVLGVCLRIGLIFKSITFGAYLFGLLQYTIMAAILSYCIFWLESKACPRPMTILAFLYFAILPTFPINAISVWKDTLYNAMLLLLIMMLYDVIKSNGKLLTTKNGIIKFILICFFACFLRNNGFFIVLITMAVLVIVYKALRKKFLIICLAFLLITKLIQGPVYNAFGISDLGVQGLRQCQFNKLHIR